MKCCFGAVFVLISLLVPQAAFAFCGFYVAGGDAKLFNDATQVALLRDGTRTILSMQNNYAGPAKSFAMVVPVPEVLDEEDVKTLDKGVFDRLDRRTAPRLVEYWERNPCRDKGFFLSPFWWYKYAATLDDEHETLASARRGEPPVDFGVEVEAKFAVGEYDIEVLSADDSSGLDSYLRANSYNIPDGAEPYLQPYVAEGSYFFVAKVDPSRAKFEDGRAVLSPLRFEYSSKILKLPIRLGMINSDGEQDLVVYLIGRGRFEVGNYPNALIPTNIEVHNEVKASFGQFYRDLFNATLKKNPGAVITEYSWPLAMKCDPCPPNATTPEDMVSIGVDYEMRDSDLVLTRLHARYARDDIGEDLVFRTADNVMGGLAAASWRRDGSGVDEVTHSAYSNQFQGRYIIRNRWLGALTCLDPTFGSWGGPPKHGALSVYTAVSPNTDDDEPVAGTGDVGRWLDQGVSELGIAGDKPAPMSPNWFRVVLGYTMTLGLMGLVLFGMRRLRIRSRRLFYLIFATPCLCCSFKLGALLWIGWTFGCIAIAIEGYGRDKSEPGAEPGALEVP